MNLTGFELDEVIKEHVKDVLGAKDAGYDPPPYCATDSFGEALEKLIILHIRTWMLEDAVGVATTDQEIADLKRKIDQCFKVKRPKLIGAMNMMVNDSIARNKSLVEDSVKLYKGV